MTTQENNFGPLTGLTVLDLSNLVAGGTSTSHLADFGAQVIKVERPQGGDLLRAWGPFKEGVSIWWTVLSRNKKSISLNLAEPQGQEILKKLVVHADVLIEAFRTGTLQKWGLEYDTLSLINSRIIMVHISGFGQTGPYSDRPGFGSIAEAMSGLVNATGFPDQPPILPPIPMADEIAGTFAAMAVLMAVYERDLGGSGKGQEIDVSLYEPLFRLLIPNVSQYDQLGLLVRRHGNRFSDGAPRNLYQAADGQWLSLSATSQGIWEPLARAIGREDLIEDPRFTTNELRVRNVEELDEIIQRWIGARPLQEGVKHLQNAGVVVFPIYNTDQIFTDPHYKAREDIVEVPHKDLGSVKMPAAIPKFSRTSGQIHTPGPSLGEHNKEVYQNLLGASPEEISRWKEQGII